MSQTYPPPTQAPLSAADSWRVLVVEPHADDATRVEGVMRRHGHTVYHVGTGREALRVLGERFIDVVLINVDLPDMDGLRVCRRIRATGNTPMIAVSRRASELARTVGLYAGADDYLTTPYGYRELMARMTAVMRRHRRSPLVTLVHGPMRIDSASRRVTLDGRDIDLPRKEYEVLRLLASHPGAVLSRRQIMEQVWGDTWSRRTLDTHVNSLRGKLGNGDWIVTVRGVGFRFDVPGSHRETASHEEPTAD